MTRSLFAGQTDYSHQTLDEVVFDLKECLEYLRRDQQSIKHDRSTLISNGYWTAALDDFRTLFSYAIKFYDTCVEEISGILEEMQIEIRQHHTEQLTHLGKTAARLNLQYGQVWHDNYQYHDYESAGFQVLAGMYAIGRDLSVDLIDLSNMA